MEDADADARDEDEGAGCCCCCAASHILIYFSNIGTNGSTISNRPSSLYLRNSLSSSPTFSASTLSFAATFARWLAPRAQRPWLTAPIRSAHADRAAAHEVRSARVEEERLGRSWRSACEKRWGVYVGEALEEARKWRRVRSESGSAEGEVVEGRESVEDDEELVVGEEEEEVSRLWERAIMKEWILAVG